MLLFTSCRSPPASCCLLRSVGCRYYGEADPLILLVWIGTSPPTRLLVLFDVVSIWLLRCHRPLERYLFHAGLRPAASHQRICKMPCCPPADRSPTHTQKRPGTLPGRSRCQLEYPFSGLFCCLPDLVDHQIACVLLASLHCLFRSGALYYPTCSTLVKPELIPRFDPILTPEQ